MKKIFPFYARKAFTLIETLIAAVLIGIVVAVAVWIFPQYQASSALTEAINDGARIGNAAQAHFAETLERSVVVQYNPVTGAITGPDTFRLQDGNKVTPGYIIPGNELKITFDNKSSFTLKHAKGGSYTFSDKGELSHSE
ncbi:MAG: type II secretion system protein [Opitutales bacterium]|nr:type II secretion system protein [Opitutales bacterium]